jgi:hypothetical protein
VVLASCQLCSTSYASSTTKCLFSRLPVDQYCAGTPDSSLKYRSPRPRERQYNILFMSFSPTRDPLHGLCCSPVLPLSISHHQAPLQSAGLHVHQLCSTVLLILTAKEQLLLAFFSNSRRANTAPRLPIGNPFRVGAPTRIFIYLHRFDRIPRLGILYIHSFVLLMVSPYK